MAHSYGERLSLPSPAPQQGFPSPPPASLMALWSVPRRKIPTLTGICPEVSRSTSEARSSHRTQLHDIMGGKHCGCGVGARVEPVVYDNTLAGNLGNAAQGRPTGGSGTTHQAATHSNSWGGPWACVGRADHRMTPGAPFPPGSCYTPPTYSGSSEIRAWGRNAATIWWFTPEEGDIRLTVANCKKGGPTYDDALSSLGDLPGPLFLMLPTDLTTALRQEQDGYQGPRMCWEAVPDSVLLAPLNRGAADGC